MNNPEEVIRRLSSQIKDLKNKPVEVDKKLRKLLDFYWWEHGMYCANSRCHSCGEPLKLDVYKYEMDSLLTELIVLLDTRELNGTTS